MCRCAIQFYCNALSVGVWLEPLDTELAGHLDVAWVRIATGFLPGLLRVSGGIIVVPAFKKAITCPLSYRAGQNYSKDLL
ncbi:MAG TPA: hypothetical protein PLK61_11855 [Nitrosomonas sp.]|nr:hypothetical protein [Nitrosomonas sp.]